jgi:hypothetical protein
VGDESNAPIEVTAQLIFRRAERFDLRPRWQRIAVAVAGPIMKHPDGMAIPFAPD